jgi:hypothetical protein
MGEISEVERLRRRLSRAGAKGTPAQSFRLGAAHLEKLKKLAQRSDLPQVEVLRDLIDKRWAEIEQARKR